MISRHVQNWIADGEKTVMTTYVENPQEITVEHIDKAFMENDVMAVKAVEQMVKYLAIWTYNLYVLLNINCFVFGGGLLEMKVRIIERVRQEFDKYNKSNMPVYFKIAELGDKSGIIGASELVFMEG
jgi:glucokinase